MHNKKNERLTLNNKATTMEAVNVNDTLSDIRTATFNLGNDIATIGKKLGKLIDLGQRLERIGGPSPYQVKAAFRGVNPIDREFTDEGFLEAIEKIQSANRDPIAAALAYANFVNKITLEIGKTVHRIDKLAERRRAQKKGPEHDAAVKLCKTAEEWKDRLDRRLEIVLDRFFDARNRVIDGITRVTIATFHCFPDGSDLLRTCALRHSSSELLQFKQLDDRILLGKNRGKRKSH